MSPYAVILFGLLKLAAGLTSSDQSCIANNPGELDNSFMVGVWYEVYRFSYWLNLPASTSCTTVNITASTLGDLEQYKAAHGDVAPFKFDSTAVLVDRADGYFTGMLTGGDQVKFYAWDPKSVFFGTQIYESRVYKKVNEEYMLFNTCAVTAMKTLLSRRRDQTEAELREVISTIEDVQRLESQRFCSPN